MDLFSVAASNNCQTSQAGLESNFCIVVVKVCQHSRVGLTVPSFKSNW